MKLSRGVKFGIGLPLLAIIVAVVAGLIWRGEYPTKQTATLSFVIEEDFTKVRKIMVRTNASKEIITMGGGSEFVEQKWDDHNVEPGIDVKKIGEGAILDAVLQGGPDWELKLDGTLKVRTLDPYVSNNGVGKSIVTLSQTVEIVPNHLQSDTKLIEGSERLLGYDMTTRLEREEDHTRVNLTLTQEIKTDAPWFAHGIADRRVRASAERTLANQEVAMRKLIEDNKDKSWVFPLN